jgi:hypothetical protein
MAALGALVVSIGAETAKFERGMDKTTYVLKKFQRDAKNSVEGAASGFDGLGGSSLRLAGMLNGLLNSGVKSVGASLLSANAGFVALAGAVLGASAAVSVLGGALKDMDGLDEMASRNGLAVESLSRLGYVAKLNGVELDGLSTGLRKLTLNSVEAANGNKEMAQVFDAFGITLKNSDGSMKNSEQLLGDVAEQLQYVTDSSQLTAIAVKLFGKSGEDMVPILKLGRDGIKQLSDEADAFGITVGAGAAAQAAKFNDNLDKLGAVSVSYGKSLLGEVLPSVNKFVDELLAATRATGGLATALSLVFANKFNGGGPGERLKELNQQLDTAKAKLAEYDSWTGTGRKTASISIQEGEIRKLMKEIDFVKQLQLNEALSLGEGVDDVLTRRQASQQAALQAQADANAKRALASNAASEAAKKQAEQEAKSAKDYLDAINTRYESMSKELEIGRELTASEKYQIEQLDKLSNGKVKLKSADEAAARAKLQGIVAMDEEIRSAREVMRLWEESKKQRLESLSSENDSITKEVEAMRIQFKEIGLNKQQLDQLNISRLDAVIAQKQLELASKSYEEQCTAETAELEYQIGILQEKRDLMGQISAGTVAAEASKKLEEDQKKMFESVTGDIAQAITNGIADGSIKGKDFLQRLFKSTVVRVFIEPMIKGTVGTLFSMFGMSGTASAAGFPTMTTAFTNMMSMYEGAKSAYTMVSGAFTNTAGTVEAAGDWMAKTFYNSSDAVADFGLQVGDYAATNSAAINQIGSAVSSVMTVYAGYKLGRGISNGYSTNGGSGNAMVNTGLAIGAAVGSIVPGLGTALGAAIGAVIGGAVNRAFGHKKFLKDSGIEGTFTTGGFNGIGFQDVLEKGGWFRGDRHHTINFDLPADSFNALSTATAAVADQFKKTASLLSVDVSKALNDFSLSGRFSVSTAEQFRDTMLGVSDAMVRQAIPSMQNFQKSGERLVETLQRVANSVFQANQAALILQSAPAFYIQTAQEAMDLMGLFGDGGMSSVQTYYDSFLSVSEQVQRSTAALTATIKQLGLESELSSFATNEQFKALVESLDLTTDAGQRELMALMSIAPAVDALNKKRKEEADAISSLSSSIGGLVSTVKTQAVSAIDAQIKQSESAASKARDAATSYKTLAKSLADTANGLVKNIIGDYEFSRAQYLTTYSSAMAGDSSALGSLGAYAQSFVDQLKNRSLDSVQYMRQVSGIKQQLEQASSVAAALGVGSDYQAQLFDVQTAALEVVKEQLEAGNLTVDLLKEHSTLLGNLANAIVASATLTVGATQNASGETVGALFDVNKLVVAQLSGDTASQIKAFADSLGLTNVTFTNSITGQTGVLSGLSESQVKNLQGLSSTQNKTMDLTNVVAQATGGSEIVLGAVLNKLGQQDTGSINIVSAINTGNVQITDYLNQVLSAIKQQSEAAAAEAKRKLDLELAQDALSKLVGAQSTLAAQVSAAADQITPLAQQYGLTLTDSGGGAADFAVNAKGLWEADWSGITYNVGNEAGVEEFKRRYYAAGGLYDQTYGMASVLQNSLNQVDAQRELIRSLGGIPAFAKGGNYAGGLALVGEEGPELINFKAPGMVYNAKQTQAIMGGGQDLVALERQLERIAKEIAQLRAEQRVGMGAITLHTSKFADQFDDVVNGGVPLPVHVAG